MQSAADEWPEQRHNDGGAHPAGATVLLGKQARVKGELRAILAEILYGLIDWFCLPPNIVHHTCAIHGTSVIRVVGKSGRICCYCHDA